MLIWILSSSVLILAVLGLRLLFRSRISHRMSYALWILVLLRLLIPGSFLHSAASVANLVSDLAVPPVFSAHVLKQEEALEQVLTEHRITQTDFDKLPASLQNAYTQQADALVESSRVDAQREIQKQEARYDSTRQILRTLWLLGVALTAGCLLWANIRFGRALFRSRRRVEAPLPVYRSAAAESPCLFGLFRPAVYLPEDLPKEDVPYVLAHERTHLRHLDHIWSVLRCLCLALHWFNPLVWVAVKVSRLDSELACDEGALERLGDECRESYGKVLIRMSRAQDRNLLLTATTMTADKRTLFARIKAIAQKPRILAAAATLMILTAAIAVGCTFTGPETAKPRETTDPETTSGNDSDEALHFGMTNALDSNFELDYRNHFIMALEEVEVKGIPSDSAATNRVLNYELVRIQAAVYRDDGKWVLISYDTFDGGDNIGWVKVSGLTEYTEDTKEKLLFPVNVSDDCKDMDTEEKVEKDEWRITSFEGEYVTITRVGGRNNKVKPEDIVYPDTTMAPSVEGLPGLTGPAVEEDNDNLERPGYASFDGLYGSSVAWIVSSGEPGLASYKDIQAELPWLSGSDIDPYKKALYAIQFTNGDILILISTNSVEGLASYAEYISEHANSLANQLQAEADIEIHPTRTMIIISKENYRIFKNAVLSSLTGQWPD